MRSRYRPPWLPAALRRCAGHPLEKTCLDPSCDRCDVVSTTYSTNRAYRILWHPPAAVLVLSARADWREGSGIQPTDPLQQQAVDLLAAFIVRESEELVRAVHPLIFLCKSDIHGI